MAAPNAEKGSRYINQLDTSLCAGAWADIPEHARKVEKHAPQRKCLTLAARSEAQVVSASHRPTSAASSASSSIHSLGDLVPKLQEALDAGQRYPEDAYIASVCLAEIHWLRGDGDEALKALQRSNTAESGSGHVTALGWQEVCEAKATFLQGVILEAKEDQQEAKRLYLGVTTRSPGSRTAELRRWTERLLARACMFMWRTTDRNSISSLSNALRCFQSWSDFWERSLSPGSGNATYLDLPRRAVWKAYYHLLSHILQSGLTYSPSQSSIGDLLTVPDESLSDEQISASRRRQRSLLRVVETTYESLLLSETQFPKANQANIEVEEWVERVIRNWIIFSGSRWTAMELGDGGQEAVARNVLDILYRASTKTFHSTAILRQLFTVHASLGEFGLAIHAFDSYVEIVSKGKTRAEKTGKTETGFDSDDMAVATAAKAIKILCKYGDREQAEKANEIVRTLRRWLGQRRPGSAVTVDTVDGADVPQSTEKSLQPTTLAAAYCAIGICRMHWSRLTFDDDTRECLRAEGVKSLGQAQAQDPADVETSVALALALAESRDVAAAMQVAKRVLAAAEAESDDEEDGVSEHWRERQLMPLWHLVALCRSVSDDYEHAAKMCEAAFGQFGDSTVLFGERGIRTSLDSEKVSSSAKGVVDRMDASEKEAIIQIKMTQLSLVELVEGADVAVKSSEELLATYTRLFGSPAQPNVNVRPPPTAVSTPPTRSGGTLRSIAGSIRPRSRSARRNSVEREQYRPPTSISEEKAGPSPSTNGHAEQTGAPIAITVTNEDGLSADKYHRHLPFKLRHHHESRSLRSTRSSERLDEKALPAMPEKTGPASNNSVKLDSSADQSSPVAHAVSQTQTSHSPDGPEQPLGAVPHNAPSSDAWPQAVGHTDQPLKQDVRLPAPHPLSKGASPQTHISGLQDRQHRASLLVDVWLFIAGMYLRADHFDDCAGAVDAAFGVVERFEEELAAQEGSSARKFFEKGWGLGRAVDELWGHVWAAKGIISVALSSPFEAMSHYEASLSYWPDHTEGIIGLSNLLMDIYEEKMPPEEPEPSILPSPPAPPASASGSTLNTTTIPPPPRSAATSSTPAPQPSSSSSSRPKDPSPAHLNRLACRDRAYMLLSSLTRQGAGSESPDAWLALARSQELSGQVERAKESLWWVLRLEEVRGVRDWASVRR